MVLSEEEKVAEQDGPQFTVDELRYIRLHLSWDNDAGYEIVKTVESKLRPFIPELRDFDELRKSAKKLNDSQ